MDGGRGGRAYPRAGGGTRESPSRPRTGPGLSPRGRGNHLPCEGPPGCGGAYPRAGGGTIQLDTVHGVEMGLSPRGRGNRNISHTTRVRPGPIPARAGEPRRCYTTGPAGEAYPRAGGGTLAPWLDRKPSWGLSPRGRGNLGLSAVDLSQGGPIPARAGEPGSCCRCTRPTWAYPRAGGGTCVRLQVKCKQKGLSPRGRGNQLRHQHIFRAHGPIPARAGEPLLPPMHCATTRAYPRAGGGTSGDSLYHA